MDTQIKQRMVGAVVLIGVVVLVFSLLLRGNGSIGDSVALSDENTSVPSYTINIPATARDQQSQKLTPASSTRNATNADSESSREIEHARDTRRLMIPVPSEKENEANLDDAIASSIDDSPPSDDAVDQNSTPVTHQKPTTATSRDTPKPRFQEKPNVSKPKKTLSITQMVVEKANSPVSSEVKKQTAAVKQTAPVKQVNNGWVVQLGSFSKQVNATKLDQRLKKIGHLSFVEAMNSGTKKVYRVRVGPEVEKVSAIKLKKKLIKDVGIEGLVMKYP